MGVCWFKAKNKDFDIQKVTRPMFIIAVTAITVLALQATAKVTGFLLFAFAFAGLLLASLAYNKPMALISKLNPFG